MMVLLLNKALMRFNHSFFYYSRYQYSCLTCIWQQDLMANSVVFAHLMEEHGNLESELDHQGDQSLVARGKQMDNKDAKFDEAGLKKADDSTGLMQIEERNTGAISWSVYHKYLRFAGSVAWAPFLLFLLMLNQVAQGMYMRKKFACNGGFLMLIFFFSWQ